MTNIAFAAEIVNTSESVVAAAFGEPVVLRNETKGPAKIPAGRIGLIANHNGYKAEKGTRRARGTGKAMLVLSAVSRVTEDELRELIEQLESLQENIAEGVRQAEAMT